MTRYGDWAPTGVDVAGLGLEDRQDWIVCPVMVTRDTPRGLTTSNFRAILDMLGGESETVEVHRFGHWGPGWLEIILAAPEHAEYVEEIRRGLDDYPVIDESLMAEEEAEEEAEAWESWGRRDFQRALEERIADKLGVMTRNVEVEGDLDEVFYDAMQLHPYGWSHSDDGASLDMQRIAALANLADLSVTIIRD